MSLNTSYPISNTRLGTSFGIFTSAFASLVLMLIILEQLGLERSWISQLIIALPVLFYAGIGVLVRTSYVEDFFLAGQRVPPLYAGFGLSANLVGGAGLLGLIGCFFFIGFDALPIGLGWCAGIGLMSVLFAPYLRKIGAYTLPGFLGIRLNSPMLRVAAALALFPPLIVLLAAELRVGQFIAGVFLPQDKGLLLQAGLTLLLVSVLFGGMRSLTWTQCAQFIVALLGVAVPLIVISLLVTNLPLPQLSFGGVLHEIGELEAARNLVEGAAVQPLHNALPRAAPGLLTQPFAALFQSISAADFVALTLCIALGAAVLPAQIARASTTPSVSGVRKSFGWAALLVGFIVLTVPAYAAFAKYQAARELLGVPESQIPDWGNVLSQLGLISLSANPLDPALGSAKVAFGRDAVVLMLPIMNGFPFVMVGLVGAAALAAVLAAAGGQLVALGTAFSNDLFYVVNRSASPARRLLMARIAMVVFAVAAYSLATRWNLDPLRMALWSLSLLAATFFAPLALAIWWRGLSSIGALAGMAAGFAVSLAAILLTVRGGSWLGVDGLTAGMLGAPLSALAAVAVSMATPKPDAATLAILDEMRVPSGETVHARLTRLAVRGKGVKP